MNRINYMSGGLELPVICWEPAVYHQGDMFAGTEVGSLWIIRNLTLNPKTEKWEYLVHRVDGDLMNALDTQYMREESLNRMQAIRRVERLDVY